VKIFHRIEMSQVWTQIRTTPLPAWAKSALESSAARPIVIFYRRDFGRARGQAKRAGSGLRIGIRRRRMTEEEEIELKAQLERLRQEHRDLDAAIEALQAVPGSDIIQVQRLKKRKLVLRDRITFIEDQLTPDIIA